MVSTENKNIESYQQEVSGASVMMIIESKKIAISSQEDAEKAADFLGKAKKIVGNIDAKRKEFTKPLNDHVKLINENFKQMKKPFERAIDVVSRKVISYQQELEAKAAEENAKLEEAEASDSGVSDSEAPHSGDSEAENETLPAASLLPKEEEKKKPSAVQRNFSGASSSMHTRTTLDFELVDISKIPREFLCLDVSAVKLKMKELQKSGESFVDKKTGEVFEIPGIKFLEKKSLSVRA